MKHWVGKSPWKVLEETVSLALALTTGNHKSLALALNMKLMSLALALVMKAKSLALALDSEICPC